MSKESDCKKCAKCGEPIERITFMPVLNIYIKGPIMCSCKKAELAAKKIKEENEAKQDKLKQVINNSLMDSKFRTQTFENWDEKLGNPKILNISRKYSEKFIDMKKNGVGLLIHGTPGNGKTYSANCIANYLIDKFVPVICVSINALLKRIQQTFNSYGKEGEATILNTLSNADLLIIDDLGTEQNTDWNKTTIYNIMDSRYRNGLPLIVTTNITLEQLKEKYHQRTYDRLIEMCTPVRNDSKSIRVEKGREKTKLLSQLLQD